MTASRPIRRRCLTKSFGLAPFSRARRGHVSSQGRAGSPSEKCRSTCQDPAGRFLFLMSNAMAFLGRDMAVDLGTANTLVYVRG
ncbi:MAG TPA: hypothetical protein VGG25_26030, partial [Streptosporangiaceae bacterium]